MAHRKPLGSTFTSTFDWRGERPELHDALVSEAGTWYRVVGVEEKRNPAKVGLMLERVAEPERFADDGVTWPDGYAGFIHTFEWYERKRKRV